MVCKKRRLVAMLLCVTLLLTSCSLFSFRDVGDLLHAPRLGQGQGKIQDALAAHLGEEPQYKFPKEGEWRSPLVMADLNGDGRQEGILFYSLVGATTAAEVYMAVLEEMTEGWQVVHIETGLSTDIASVEVAEMFNDGTKQLIVGYFSTALTNKIMALYRYVGPDFTSMSLMAGNYTMYLLDDFTGTGRWDIALVSIQEETGICLDFISAQNNRFERIQRQVQLYANFTACRKLQPSLGAAGERLIVVDGEIGGNLASQILNYSGSGEGFYPRPDTAEMANSTLRYSLLLTSRDIDGDGRVETPLDKGNNYVSVPADKNLRAVEWYSFIVSPHERKQHGILDIDKGIYVRLPDNWADYYEVTINAAYDDWQVRDRRTGEALLQIRPARTGEITPGEEKHVPDTQNLYVFPTSAVGVSERQQICVYSLL